MKKNSTRAEDIAWIGGLFEGEGSWGCTIMTRKDGSKRHHMTASLGQKGENGKIILEYFQKIVGGNLYHFKQGDMWGWQIGGRKAVGDFYTLIKPWLSQRRVKRAEEIIALCKLNGEDRRYKR